MGQYEGPQGQNHIKESSLARHCPKDMYTRPKSHITECAGEIESASHLR